MRLVDARLRTRPSRAIRRGVSALLLVGGLPLVSAPTAGAQTYGNLPYYSEEELRVLTEASRSGRAVQAAMARRSFGAAAESVRAFLDLAGELDSESATKLAVVYGTKMASDLVAGVAEPPNYLGATEVLKVLGERLSRVWFPRESFEEQVRGVISAFHETRVKLSSQLAEVPTPLGQLDLAERFARESRELGVPRERINQILEKELEGIVGLVIETRDYAAARLLLGSRDLEGLTGRGEERQLRRILEGD